MRSTSYLKSARAINKHTLQPVLGIVAGVAVAVVGVGYVVLEYIPSIEPPQNMRDAGGEWGAEQI